MKEFIIITMNWNDILNFLRNGDQRDVKFFGSSISRDDFGQTVVAMANTIGGYIIMGIDSKNYHLNGTHIDRAWIDGVIKECCHPKILFDVFFVNKNDKVICVVSIKDVSAKPYYFNRQCFIMDNFNKKLVLLEQNSIKDTFDEQNHSDDLINNSDDINPEDLSHLTSELLELSDSIPTDILPDISNVSQHDVSSETQDDTQSDQIVMDLLTPTSSSENNVGDLDSLNDRQKLALDYLSEESFIKNKMYRELFDVSHKTAHLELVDLVSKQFIMSQGSGRSTCYVLNKNKQQKLI